MSEQLKIRSLPHTHTQSLLISLCFGLNMSALSTPSYADLWSLNTHTPVQTHTKIICSLHRLLNPHSGFWQLWGVAHVSNERKASLGLDHSRILACTQTLTYSLRWEYVWLWMALVEWRLSFRNVFLACYMRQSICPSSRCSCSWASGPDSFSIWLPIKTHTDTYRHVRLISGCVLAVKEELQAERMRIVCVIFGEQNRMINKRWMWGRHGCVQTHVSNCSQLLLLPKHLCINK